MSAVVTPRSAHVARPKVAKNYRFRPEVVAMVDELAELHGQTRTDVIELAIREKYRRDTKQIRPEMPDEKPRKKS